MATSLCAARSHIFSRFSFFSGFNRQHKLNPIVAFYSSSNSKDDHVYDIAIVGGGIVGVATARELATRHASRLSLCLLEKEDRPGVHQSGHNSGVIHAGIYYTPGSLKATLCSKGRKLTYQYLEEKKLPYKRCGKLIVAVSQQEVDILSGLYKRGVENEVEGIELIGPQEISQIEPNCRGLKAIWSPNTGIADYGAMNRTLCDDFSTLGGKAVMHFKVVRIDQQTNDAVLRVHSERGKVIKCKYLVTCAGLYSDKIAIMAGCDAEPKILPFRGEYLLLKSEKSDLVKTNIYPVPDPSFPFLGVHFTPRVDGRVILGPNAILAFKREGYRFGDVDIPEMLEALRYPGLQRLISKYPLAGLSEVTRGFFTSAQVAQLQRYVPSLQQTDVEIGPSGVRAQAMYRDGRFVDDFVIDVQGRTLHVRNAPSPAATSSLAIAHYIADKVQQTFNL